MCADSSSGIKAFTLPLPTRIHKVQNKEIGGATIVCSKWSWVLESQFLWLSFAKNTIGNSFPFEKTSATGDHKCVFVIRHFGFTVLSNDTSVGRLGEPRIWSAVWIVDHSCYLLSHIMIHEVRTVTCYLMLLLLTKKYSYFIWYRGFPYFTGSRMRRGNVWTTFTKHSFKTKLKRAHLAREPSEMN